MAAVIPAVDNALSSNTEVNPKSDVPKKKSKGHRCYFCGQRFLDKNILRKHISVHKDRDFFCEVCGKAFSANWGLRKHMKIHTGERPFQCEYCGKAFIQKCTLQFHIKAIHSNKAQPRCKSCGKRLKTTSNVQCWLCRYEGKEIIDEDEQSSHNMKQNDSSSLNLGESQNLEFNAASKNDMVNSDDNCEGNLQNSLDADKISVSCGTCKICFQSPAELQQHIINSDHCSAAYICDHCGLKCEDCLSLQQHLLMHSELRPYVCQKCGKGFKKDYNLRQHMITHKEDRPYVCKICKSAFKSIPCLRQHMVSHSEDRPYICKECGSGFKSMQGLKTHILIHNKIKPLSCKTCGKTFNFLGNLQRHFRVHTGERPYQCRYCEKRFSQSNGLKAHELTHQRPEKLVEESICNVCGRKFRSYSNFKKHLLLHG